jgi:hypothetical protein
MSDPQHLTTLQASTTCYRDNFAFSLHWTGDWLKPGASPDVVDIGGFFTVLCVKHQNCFRCHHRAFVLVSCFRPAQAVKILIALAVYCTYGLQFYVCLEIGWNAIKNTFTKRPLLSEYAMRTFLVFLTSKCWNMQDSTLNVRRSNSWGKVSLRCH